MWHQKPIRKRIKWSESLSSAKVCVTAFLAVSHHHPKQKTTHLSSVGSGQTDCVHHAEHYSGINRHATTWVNIKGNGQKARPQKASVPYASICTIFLQRDTWETKQKPETRPPGCQGRGVRGRTDHTGHGGGQRALKLPLPPDSSCGYITANNSKLADTR